MAVRGIKARMHAPGKEINKIWPEIVGPKFSPYTVVEKIKDNTLFIKVRSALALSHLVMHEQENILMKIKSRIENSGIERIVFRR